MGGEAVMGIALAKWWIFLAALAGAITGVLVRKGLTVSERLSGLFIGLATTVFLVAPILSHFGLPATSEKGAAVIYVTASCANYVMPHVVRAISRKVLDLISASRPGGDL